MIYEFAAIQTMLARMLTRMPGKEEVLNPWTRSFLDKLDNLKFIPWVDSDGYPFITSAIQAQSLDGQHILFSTSVYADELKGIPTGTDVPVFGMALTMEGVLLRGKYLGIQRMTEVKAGMVQVDCVYNPKHPVPG